MITSVQYIPDQYGGQIEDNFLFENIEDIILFPEFS